MKRNREIKIKVSSEELKKIRQKSERLGMSVSSYLRFLGLKSSLKVISGE